MLYLKLNESNQIVIGTAEDYQIPTMDCQYTVAWVEGNEIKIWGTSDDRGFIDSTKHFYPEVSLPASETLEDDQLSAYVTDAVRFLEGKACRIYKDDVQL